MSTAHFPGNSTWMPVSANGTRARSLRLETCACVTVQGPDCNKCLKPDIPAPSLMLAPCNPAARSPVPAAGGLA